VLAPRYVYDGDQIISSIERTQMKKMIVRFLQPALRVVREPYKHGLLSFP
jgi:hypothetical protein